MQILDVFFLIGLLTYLIYQLNLIGWSIIWESRPRNLSFYILFIVSYLTLPFSDFLIYGRLH